MRVAEAGCRRTGKNAQAGGASVPKWRARRDPIWAVENARAAFAANALLEYAGRAKTAMTIVLKIFRQRCQRSNWTRLSAPISQTNCVRLNRRAHASSVSAVKRVPSHVSSATARSRGSPPHARRTLAIRAASGAMPLCALSGFCGLTMSQTSSRSSRFKASRAMWAWPACAGLNEPPNKPTRRLGARPRRWRGETTLKGASAPSRAARICRS